jgi:FemAB-related protein (PEP-CTERM system-associated)
MMETVSESRDNGIEICELKAEDQVHWDAFVDTCSEATFFHHAGWKTVLERAFGHSTHFLFAQRNGRIEGVLPLGHIHSLLFGNSLISTPFCVYGGVAASSEAARLALTQAGVELAQKLRVDYLELRHLEPQNPDWPCKKELYVTFRKAIDPDPEKNLSAIPRKQRAVVRKGIKAGLVSVIDDDIKRFYYAYSTSVRNLGTPVFSHKYFRTLKEVFGDACEILTVELEGQVMASVMSFYFRDEVLPYYGGGIAEARQVKANDFMYWELMRRAAEQGCRVFDYGRSKQGTGSYSFKKHWGFEPQPLHYEFKLVKAREIPDVNPLNPKYHLFIKAWQRLPLPVSQWIGSLISKNLG